MKKVLLLVVIAFASCKKEVSKPFILVKAKIKLEGEYISRQFTEDRHHLTIQVGSIGSYDFDTYYNNCSAKSFGFSTYSQDTLHPEQYIIYSERDTLEVGIINFTPSQTSLTFD